MLIINNLLGAVRVMRRDRQENREQREAESESVDWKCEDRAREYHLRKGIVQYPGYRGADRHRRPQHDGAVAVNLLTPSVFDSPN